MTLELNLQDPQQTATFLTEVKHLVVLISWTANKYAHDIDVDRTELSTKLGTQSLINTRTRSTRSVRLKFGRIATQLNARNLPNGKTRSKIMAAKTSSA